MKKASCVYCIDRELNKVLMAWQQYKIIGLKGYGGGFDPEKGDKTMEDCAVREAMEEGGIYLKQQDLELLGHIDFYNGTHEEISDSNPSFSVWFYRCFRFSGKPISTDEMRDPAWYDLANLPFKDMIVGDHLFVPQILRGEKIKGWLRRTGDLKQVIKSSFKACTLEDLAL